MTMAMNNEIVNVLKILEAAYGRALEERTALVYLNTLDDLDAATLEKAAYHWIKAGKQFFPKVVELRETYAQVKRTPGADAGIREYWIGMETLRLSVHGLAAEDDPRFTHYYRPGWRDGQTDESRDWWGSLPAPAATDAGLAARYAEEA